MSIHKLPWTCSLCGSSTLLEESRAGVETRVTGITDDGHLVTGQIECITPEHIDRYMCAVCGTEIKDGPVVIDSRKHLAEWLLAR